MNDVLQAEHIQAALKPQQLGTAFLGAPLTVQVFDELPSTNAYLSESAKQFAAPQSQLCITDCQTQGSGRRGKTWETPAGEITFSVLSYMAKKPHELLGLSLVTGIVIAQVLHEQYDIEVQLKWPNDVYVDGIKLCGLLTELAESPFSATQIITGIGINYQPRSAEQNAAYSATSLSQLCAEPPPRNEVIVNVVERLLHNYAVFEHQGWSVFQSQWQRYDYLSGREITVFHETSEEQAVAVGVNEHGALLIQQGEQVRPLYSGDVSVRLRGGKRPTNERKIP